MNLKTKIGLTWVAESPPRPVQSLLHSAAARQTDTPRYGIIGRNRPHCARYAFDTAGNYKPCANFDPSRTSPSMMSRLLPRTIVRSGGIYAEQLSRASSKACETRYRPLWDVTIAGPPRRPVWCRLYGTATGNTQNGGTVLPIADSESGSPDSYSSS